MSLVWSLALISVSLLQKNYQKSKKAAHRPGKTRKGHVKMITISVNMLLILMSFALIGVSLLQKIIKNQKRSHKGQERPEKAKSNIITKLYVAQP